MTMPPACRVERLRLFRFRNYADEVVALGGGLNVISGANAQGKTNLLEAVATAALTRSPRAAASAELVTWGEEACRVEMLVRRPDGPTVLDVRFRHGSDGARVVRSTMVDGQERPARSLLGRCPVVLFWPDDLLLVKGGPDGRRRMLDMVLAQLDQRTAAELLRYRHVLEQRNALLRQLKLGSADPASLAGFTAELVRAGGWVRAARARLLAAMQPLAAAALRELSGAGEELELAYAPQGGEGSGDGTPPSEDPQEAAEALAATLRRSAAEERARGVTVAGPHRDDVEIRLDGRPARTAASQGQQRSLVLAWKLAEVRHVGAVAGMAPVLLLDDVLSELDPDRRAHLLLALGAGRGAQAILTTAETAPLDLDGAGDVAHLLVREGHVVSP